jgi:hypothetical protein
MEWVESLWQKGILARQAVGEVAPSLGGTLGSAPGDTRWGTFAQSHCTGVYRSPLLMCLQFWEWGGWQGERIETAQKALQLRTKRGKGTFEDSRKQKCATLRVISLSTLAVAFKVATHIQLRPSFVPTPSSFPLAASPVLSFLHWHRHGFHLSNCSHFPADVLRQSYKAFMSLFLINQILSWTDFKR